MLQAHRCKRNIQLVMHTYAVTYINNTGVATTKNLSAPNKFLLTVEIYQEIQDMKDGNADNIIAVEEI